MRALESSNFYDGWDSEIIKWLEGLGQDGLIEGLILPCNLQL